MTDDLVKRLREASCLTFDDWTTVGPYNDYGTALEAADLLEQLAANIEALTAERDVQHEAWKQAMDAFDKKCEEANMHHARANAAEADNARLRALLSEADARIAWESIGFGNDFAERVEAALNTGDEPK
jgi:hypothetical protein